MIYAGENSNLLIRKNQNKFKRKFELNLSNFKPYTYCSLKIISKLYLLGNSTSNAQKV